jgi:hypothetical protein
MIRTIAVCEAEMPFVHGGAELCVRRLVTAGLGHCTGLEAERLIEARSR